MGLKEVAQKFSISKKELDQAFFSEMRSILNAVEVELNHARDNQKELLEAAKELLAYEYGNGGELQVDNIEAMPDEFKRLYEAVKNARSGE